MMTIFLCVWAAVVIIAAHWLFGDGLFVPVSALCLGTGGLTLLLLWLRDKRASGNVVLLMLLFAGGMTATDTREARKLDPEDVRTLNAARAEVETAKAKLSEVEAGIRRKHGEQQASISFAVCLQPLVTVELWGDYALITRGLTDSCHSSGRFRWTYINGLDLEQTVVKP